MIKDIVVDEYINGETYLVKDAKEFTLQSGTKLFNVTLQDNSGTIEAKTFNYNQRYIDAIKPGVIIKIYGKVKENKGKVFMDLDSYTLPCEGEYEMDNLIQVSPIDFNTLKEELKTYLDSIKDEDLHAITKKLIVDNYKKYLDYPAASKNHHDFMHGLLHHSLSMCHLIDGIVLNYKELNRDLLISGALLHDLGKVVELSGVIATKYTLEGSLLGHLVIGVEMIDSASKELNIDNEKVLLLKHMIASHHGKQEFGALVLPQTKEALILSMVDDMDAKMMSIDKAFENTENGSFSERIFPLDNRAFYKN